MVILFTSVSYDFQLYIKVSCSVICEKLCTGLNYYLLAKGPKKLTSPLISYMIKCIS